MSATPDAPDTSDAPGTSDTDRRIVSSRPVPRASGQLPAAASERRRGRIASDVRASWWYTLSGLVMLIAVGNYLVLIPAFLHDHIDLTRATLIAVLCAVSSGVQLTFSTGLRRGMGQGVRNWPVAGAMLLAGGMILALAAPLQWSSFPLITAVSLIACQLGGRAWWAASGISAAAIAAEYAAIPEGVDRGAGAFVLQVFFPVIIWTTVWAWDIVRRLDDARSAEGRLAVARERLRFAADLHDIQGHTLQVIALKSELAERLLPQDSAARSPKSPESAGTSAAPIDPARVAAARAQIAEIRALAADAMADTRELVQGYRAPTLESELDNAREVLAAAGFSCEIHATELPDEPATRAILGRVLREATTNVLRHGQPGPVTITLARITGYWRLRMANAASDVGPGRALTSTQGSGLAGLRERLSEAGGELSVLVDAPVPAPSNTTGQFTLTATIPIDQEIDQ